jgi:hypothetical protein
VSGAESALERAMLEAIAADAEVKALLGDPVRVGELGSPLPAYPYLEIGRHTSEPLAALMRKRVSIASTWWWSREMRAV